MEVYMSAYSDIFRMSNGKISHVLTDRVLSRKVNASVKILLPSLLEIEKCCSSVMDTGVVWEQKTLILYEITISLLINFLRILLRSLASEL